MLSLFPALSGVPGGTSAVLDMTAEFAPLLHLGLAVGLGILLFAIATAVHDTWWEPRKARRASVRPASEPDLPKAA